MRDPVVSMTKGIGIILMVVGHSGCPVFLHDFIYMFHMPLFFIMAGWCFKETYLKSISKYVFKKLKGLYVPYVVISLLFLLLHNIFVRLHLEAGTIYDFKDIVGISKSIIVSLHKHEQLLGAMWFVPQLLYSSIIAVLSLKFVKNRIVVLLSLLTMTILSQKFSLGIPYTGVGYVTFFAAAFYVMGSRLAKEANVCSINTCVICAMGIVVYVASVINPSSIFVKSPLWVLPYFCVAVIGTIVVINISNIVEKSQKKILLQLKGGLCYLGDNSIYILVLHFLAFKTLTFVYIKLFGLSIERLTDFPVLEGLEIPGSWILYSIVGVGLPTLMCWLYHRIKKYAYTKTCLV